MAEQISIVLVDDQSIVRRGLVSFLGAFDDLEVSCAHVSPHVTFLAFKTPTRARTESSLWMTQNPMYNAGLI